MPLVAAFIFIGGINRIARVTEKWNSVNGSDLYCGCLIIFFMNLEGTGRATHFVAALTPKRLWRCGGCYCTESHVSVWQRGLFSNEAGMGSTLTPMQLQM